MIFTAIAILIISALMAAWVYPPRKRPLLFLLRSGSVALFLLFLWNPACVKKEKKAEKPVLYLVEDHSQSVRKYQRDISSVIEKIAENKWVRKKFLVKHLFADTLLHTRKPDDFAGQTDLNAVLESLKNQPSTKHPSAVVLITDGISTRGKDYRYALQPSDRRIVFPVVVGDTASYPDLKIVRVDYNKKVGKGNHFPVHIKILYESPGNPVKTRLIIRKNRKIIYTQPLVLSESKPLVEIEKFFREEKPGIQKYTIEITPFQGEKITYNNRKNIWFEVVDKKAEILLLTSKIHPDAGAFRRILSRDKAYKIHVDNNLNAPVNYDLIIVFQPQKKILEQLKKFRKSVFWVTGKFTDWQALNQAQQLFEKQAVALSPESYFARLNPSFSLFSLPEFNKQMFPPLEDVFGKVRLLKPAEIVFYADVKNVSTHQALMAIFPKEKQAVLLGEGIWRWYMTEKKENGEARFTEALIHKTVRELLSRPGKDLLILDYKEMYENNMPVEIRIQAYNNIGELNPNAELQFKLKTPKRSRSVPLFFKNGSFVAHMDNLLPGEYSFSVSYPQYQIQRSGFFIVRKSNMEQISLPSDVKKLSDLAEHTGGKIFFPSQTKDLIKQLLEDKRLKTVFHVKKTKSPVTNKYIWLLLAVFLLSLEWFYRKSKGLI